VIISRTPFRVSFAGGGTDLPAFFLEHAGAVVSTAIDKYMYITVNRFFDDRIMLKYSKTELVARASAVRQPILREALKLTGISGGIEITSMADIPGGTGLGSSSSFAVGVLHALHAYKGEFVTAEQLAREACDIELLRLKEPGGKQDQYIAGYGGFQFFEFMPNGTVKADPVIFPDKVRADLKDRLILLYSGITRSSGSILRRQHGPSKDRTKGLLRLRELAEFARRELQLGMLDGLGEILHESWEIKKSLGGGVTNTRIDRAYSAARRAGAAGGKILGAGGGGFLLLIVPPKKRAAVLRALGGWREIPFDLEPEGSKIIYVSK
jgi:D-glycero-alpha-D-manno-heptose-7-phosphate kinase